MNQAAQIHSRPEEAKAHYWSINYLEPPGTDPKEEVKIALERRQPQYEVAFFGRATVRQAEALRNRLNTLEARITVVVGDANAARDGEARARAEVKAAKEETAKVRETLSKVQQGIKEIQRAKKLDCPKPGMEAAQLAAQDEGIYP